MAFKSRTGGGGAGGVTSFNGRTGAVVPVAGDYPIPRNYQVIATRGMIPNSIQQYGFFSAPNFRCDTRIKCFVGNSSVSSLRLGYCGTTLNASGTETFFGNDYGIEAAIELLSPAMFENAIFQGGDYGLVGNKGLVISEPINISIPAGGAFEVRSGYKVNQSTYMAPSCSKWLNTSALGDFGSFSQAFDSQVQGTGAMSVASGGSTNGSLPYGAPPYLVLGIPTSPLPSVCILGDSIADGSGDTSNSGGTGPSALGSAGYIARGLESVSTQATFPIAYVKTTVASDTFAHNIISSSPFKRNCWQYVTHLVCELGINDVCINLSTLATLQTYVTNLCADIRSVTGPYGKPIKIAFCTLMPQTTSSNLWVDAAGQTPVTGATVGGVRDTYNAWLVTQVGILFDYLIDPNVYVEDQVNHGKWITNGTANYPTADGVHPTTALAILAAQAINSWAQTITATT